MIGALAGAIFAIAALMLFAVTALAFAKRGGFEGALAGFQQLTFKRFVALRYLMVAKPVAYRRYIGMSVAANAVLGACLGRFGVDPLAPAPLDPAWWLALVAEGFALYAMWNLLRHRRGAVTAYFGGLAISIVARAAIWAITNLAMFEDVEFVHTPTMAIILVGALAFGGLLALVPAVYGILRHSKPALVTCYVAIGIAILGLATEQAMAHRLWWFEHPQDLPDWFLDVVIGLKLGGAVLAGVAAMFGILRAYFTFYSTVPIGGVWIGTAALVCVLSVMTGFETDLRDKILGSNAHLQVSREEGEFTEWRDIKKRIDAMPGVVASTAFAQSEVVIAADNNGMNVVIKGIDPATVGSVTKLVANIEGADDAERADAMKRLEPMVHDPHDVVVKPGKSGAGSGSAIDPPPSDLPSAGDPIDFSKTDTDDFGNPSPPPAGSGAGSATAPSEEVDAPPADLLQSDDPPIDYSQPGSIDVSIHTIDDYEPQVSRRTLSLPGILVGRELVKQTHIYRDKEVRVVSPLSDPSNPDATGTPIPFNRDYRVAGVFFSGMYEYDLKYVYVTLESLQQFLDRGDTVDGIEIRIKSPDDSDAMVQKVSEALGPKYRVQDWKDLNRSLFTALSLEKIAMFLVLGIVILVASFAIVGNLIMVVVEKGKEIALLKTLGASDASVMQVFAIQGLFIGLIGTAIGVATGLIACWTGQRFNIPLNPDVYYIDKMPIVVEPISVFITAVTGVGISIAATFYPALVAARVRPAAGMRH